jgi:phosphoribosylanthranilate isomerase
MATGKTHNWGLSKKIRENSSIPTYLAGSINKDNIKKAIEHVKPFVIA